MSVTCDGEGSLVTVSHGCKVSVGDSLLLDVVQLVDPLLARHKLADGSADHCGTYVVIVATRTPFFWGDHLQAGRQGGRAGQAGGVGVRVASLWKVRDNWHVMWTD